MKRPMPSLSFGLLLLLAISATAQPSPAAVAAFDSYVASVESRLALQHRSPEAFLVAEPEARLRLGESIVEQITPGVAPPGALLHHWRASAFAAHATSADLERLLEDFPAYPRVYAPQVLEARVVSGGGDRLQAFLRVRQHHVITVMLDSTYDVRFGRLDPAHGFSVSRSTSISELDSAGRALPTGQDHGFLWRTVTFWSWEERDGGLLLQIESVSLSRAIPAGLGWAVRPFVESVPRESLEFTLDRSRLALGRSP